MLEVFDPRKQFCDESDDGPALAEEVPAYVPYLGLGFQPVESDCHTSSAKVWLVVWPHCCSDGKQV